MARRKGVLRAEGGAKGVDIAECKRKCFAIKLAADGKVGRRAKEILREIHRAILCARRVSRVKRRHTEHLTCALAIARRENRRMYVKKAALVKEAVDGLRHNGAHAERCLKGVRARAEVLYGAQIFQRVTLFLQRIIAGALSFNHN